MFMRLKLTDIHGIEVNVEVAREDDVLINTDHKYVPLNEAIISMLDKDMVSDWLEKNDSLTPEDLGFDIADFAEEADCRDIDGEDYWNECGHYNQQRLIKAMKDGGYKIEEDD